MAHAAFLLALLTFSLTAEVEGARIRRLAARVQGQVGIAPLTGKKKEAATPKLAPLPVAPPAGAKPKISKDIDALWGLATTETSHRSKVTMDVPNPRALKFKAEAEQAKRDGRTKWTRSGIGDADFEKTKKAFVPGCTGYLTDLKNTFKSKVPDDLPNGKE